MPLDLGSPGDAAAFDPAPDTDRTGSRPTPRLAGGALPSQAMGVKAILDGPESASLNVAIWKTNFSASCALGVSQ